MKIGDLVKVFGEGVGIVCGELRWETPVLDDSGGIDFDDRITLVDVMFSHGVLHIVADDCEVINENR